MKTTITGFLRDIEHGPCGSVNLADYERNIRQEAIALLRALADEKLESAGAYGRTIERWWSGFYGSYTVGETAEMPIDQITSIITRESWRG